MAPTPLLEGKITVITGGSRGIGLATARTFAAAGATVVLLGRSTDALQAACESVREAAPAASVSGIGCDVSAPDSVRDAFQAIFRQHKRLHALVANAGVLDDALIGMVTPAQIRQTFDVNTFGVLYCAQAASRLIARSGGGAIINVSSIIGRNGNAGQAVFRRSFDAQAHADDMQVVVNPHRPLMVAMDFGRTPAAS